MTTTDDLNLLQCKPEELLEVKLSMNLCTKIKCFFIELKIQTAMTTVAQRFLVKDSVCREDIIIAINQKSKVNILVMIVIHLVIKTIIPMIITRIVMKETDIRIT